MSSGMNTEQAKEYAKTMTYSEAVSNVRYSKGIKYRKATMIKLRELAEIADSLDKANASQTEGYGFSAKAMRSTELFADTPQTDCDTCKYGEDKRRYAYICNECGVGISNYTPQTMEGTTTANHFYGREGESK